MKEFRKKGKSILVLLLAVSLLGALLAGCGSSSGDDTEDTAETSAQEVTDDSTESGSDDGETTELKTLTIGVGGSEDTGFTLEVAAIAYENGYLEEELNAIGYTIEFVAFSSAGVGINEALASGDVDGAIYGDFPAFTSKSGGIDTTIVATVNQRMQYALLSGSEEITSAQDLEGKSVIVMSGTVQQYFWEKYAEANGLDTDSIELINSSDAASLLSTGSADAYAGNIYVLAYQESLGVGTIIDYGSDYDIYTTMVVTIRSSLLEEDPEIGTAINKALIRAYNAAIEDPESLYEAVEGGYMTSEIMKTEYEFDESLWYLTPEFAEDTLEYLADLNTWMYENGLIAEEIDLDTFINTEYYDLAVEALAAEE